MWSQFGLWSNARWGELDLKICMEGVRQAGNLKPSAAKVCGEAPQEGQSAIMKQKPQDLGGWCRNGEKLSRCLEKEKKLDFALPKRNRKTQ